MFKLKARIPLPQLSARFYHTAWRDNPPGYGHRLYPYQSTIASDITPENRFPRLKHPADLNFLSDTKALPHYTSAQKWENIQSLAISVTSVSLNHYPKAPKKNEDEGYSQTHDPRKDIIGESPTAIFPLESNEFKINIPSRIPTTSLEGNAFKFIRELWPSGGIFILTQMPVYQKQGAVVTALYRVFHYIKYNHPHTIATKMDFTGNDVVESQVTLQEAETSHLLPDHYFESSALDGMTHNTSISDNAWALFNRGNPRLSLPITSPHDIITVVTEENEEDVLSAMRLR